MEDNNQQQKTLDLIENKICLYPDFPKKDVLFRDIMPIMSDPALFDSLIQVFCDRVKGLPLDRILGVESRGFLLGPLLAQKLKLPFHPIRKKGKLPGPCYQVQYELEYGVDSLELQKSALSINSRCLIVDDLIATGGSLEASCKLVEMSGSAVVACAVIVELKALDGRQKLREIPLITLFSY